VSAVGAYLYLAGHDCLTVVIAHGNNCELEYFESAGFDPIKTSDIGTWFNIAESNPRRKGACESNASSHHPDLS
jgi:hypothetical protein